MSLYAVVLNVQTHKHGLIKSQIIEFLSSVVSNENRTGVTWWNKYLGSEKGGKQAMAKHVIPVV